MENNNQSNLNHPYPYDQNDDEIDLVEFWNILVKQKLLIISFTVIVTGIALAYALLIPPTYKSESILIKPTQEQIQSLQMPGIMSLDTTSAFSLFKKHINSTQTRREIFDNNELLNAPANRPNANNDALFDQFNKEAFSLSLSVNKKGDIPTDSLTISFEHTNPEFTANVINQFIELAEKKSLAEINADSQSIITIKKENLLREITLLRDKAEVLRLDSIARLKEAKAISEKTGIIEPITLSNNAAPLYYRSPKSLLAEIEQLQNRKSNDPFIGELREKQNELQKLKLLQLNTENASIVTVDQKAPVPYEKIKPRRSLIVAVGFILGGMLGIFIAFIRNSILVSVKKFELKKTLQTK